MTFVSLRFAILGILDAKPMTGYELGRRFATSARWVWAAPRSQIYPLLAKLEAEGGIVGENAIVDGRAQRRYSITEAGSRELRNWVRESHERQPVRDSFLLQALFFDVVDAEEAQAVLRDEIAAESARVSEWEAHRDALSLGETPVIRARLHGRPPSQRDRIMRIKAAAFDGLVEAGRVRMRWLQSMLDAVAE